MKEIILFKQSSILFALMLTSSAYGQVKLSSDVYATAYCGVADGKMTSFPGIKSYESDSEGHALRKSDGGLLAVSVERGIGCEVALRESAGSLFAHVVARRVSVEPLVFDKEQNLLQEPKPKVDYWERDVDMSKVDRVEFSEDEVPLRMRVIVGILRSN
jgi:hypothetical protein